MLSWVRWIEKLSMRTWLNPSLKIKVLLNQTHQPKKKKSTQDVKLDGVGFVGLVDWKQIPIRDNMR